MAAALRALVESQDLRAGSVVAGRRRRRSRATRGPDPARTRAQETEEQEKNNADPGAYADVIAEGSVRIERLLPGPIERVWAWLTDGELRRQWLASGDMRLEAGAPFELVWRNDELS
ncbi:MAG TPA: SRPBCC domain-containing protein, partial [Dokdonella sp.]